MILVATIICALRKGNNKTIKKGNYAKRF